jgi:hypothetical protein
MEYKVTEIIILQAFNPTPLRPFIGSTSAINQLFTYVSFFSPVSADQPALGTAVCRHL